MNHLQKSTRTFALVQLLLFLSSCRARLGGGASSEPAKNMHKSSVASHPTGNFGPLDCNAHLDQDPCTTTFSSLFRGSQWYETVVIPCGKCVMMDRPVEVLQFFAGLDIRGKLLIPDGTQINIRTTYILVLGELEMESSKPINGAPDILIQWIHTEDELPITWRPPNSQCGEPYDECDLGTRPFVVAGGKVTMRGLPSLDMPTFVPLLDLEASSSGWAVSADQYEKYQPPKEDCPEVLIDHDFTKPNGVFGATGGSKWEWTGHSLKVSTRRREDHGPTIDLGEVQHCLQEGHRYILTAQILLTGGPDKGKTQCAKSGHECMSLISKHRTVQIYGENHRTIRDYQIVLWSETQSHKTRFGQVLTIAFDFAFGEIPTNIVSHSLELSGPSSEIDMELLQFTMRLPPPEAFPDPQNVCGNLVPANGHAELLGLSPFPFQTNNPNTHIVVAEEDSNHYFSVTGREFALSGASLFEDDDWNDVGLSWELPWECLKPKTTFRVHVDVRVHSEKPVAMEWDIRSHAEKKNDRSEVYNKLVTCPPSQGDWVSCDGEYTVTEELVDGSSRFEILAETLGTFTVDYDVDNLSIELGEGPLDRLILPSTIRRQWVAGAEVLITSHTADWENHEVKEIARVEDHGEHVVVLLTSSIERPITQKENPQYATEIALLSRNIELQSGSHFSVWHTPGVTQIIQGIDLKYFGEEGIRDRYPIHFDYLQDASGSMISKNTIRHSSQRCVVLHATDNVVVEGNVAYDTAGHCYALESGMEVGNIFENNLGALTKKVNNIMPQMGVSGKETDKTPATFWITNPFNHWQGNVASGSEGYGFWMQLRPTPRGPHKERDDEDFAAPLHPNELSIGTFRDNAAHSINEQALRVTNYMPTSHNEIFDGFKSYLNPNGPLYISSSENLLIAHVILDRPLYESYLIEMEDVSVVEIRGCNNVTGIDQDAAVQNREEPTNGAPPSASSVFYLEESR